MDITQILELDKSSREQVKAARRQADAIDSETPAKVQELRDEQYRLAQEKIDAFDREQNEMAAERIEETGHLVQERMDRLNQQYDENADGWLDYIVSHVTEV